MRAVWRREPRAVGRAVEWSLLGPYRSHWVCGTPAAADGRRGGGEGGLGGGGRACARRRPAARGEGSPGGGPCGAPSARGGGRAEALLWTGGAAPFEAEERRVDRGALVHHAGRVGQRRHRAAWEECIARGAWAREWCCRVLERGRGCGLSRRTEAGRTGSLPGRTGCCAYVSFGARPLRLRLSSAQDGDASGQRLRRGWSCWAAGRDSEVFNRARLPEKRSTSSSVTWRSGEIAGAQDKLRARSG